jgi:hypothetical protein
LDATAFFLTAGLTDFTDFTDFTGFVVFVVLARLSTAGAATAGSASDSTDTATSPHKKILGNTVTERLVSVCYRSLWHPKKTRNIKNLRDLSQVSLWITQVMCRQPCAATRSPLLCSLLSAER